jgi:quinolinate synthase
MSQVGQSHERDEGLQEPQEKARCYCTTNKDLVIQYRTGAADEAGSTRKRPKSCESAKRNSENEIKSYLSQVRVEVIEIRAVRAQAKDAWQRMILRSSSTLMA